MYYLRYTVGVFSQPMKNRRLISETVKNPMASCISPKKPAGPTRHVRPYPMICHKDGRSGASPYSTIPLVYMAHVILHCETS